MDSNGSTPHSNGTDTSDHKPAPTPNRSGRSRVVQVVQAANLQRFAYDCALALKQSCTEPETGKLVMDSKTACSVQKLIDAWDTARNAVRVLRGKGLPASVRSKQAKTSTIEPLNPA